MSSNFRRMLPTFSSGRKGKQFSANNNINFQMKEENSYNRVDVIEKKAFLKKCKNSIKNRFRSVGSKKQENKIEEQSDEENACYYYDDEELKKENDLNILYLNAEDKNNEHCFENIIVAQTEQAWDFDHLEVSDDSLNISYDDDIEQDFMKEISGMNFNPLEELDMFFNILRTSKFKIP